jgi:hypothetical protein
MKWLMRQCLLVCLALAVVSSAAPAAFPGEVGGASGTPEVIGRVHFIGFQRVNGASGGQTFKEIWNLPASAQLRSDTLDKLAAALAAHFEPKANHRNGGCAALIRPLLNDLWDAEVYAEAVERTRNILDSTLALHLDDARMRVWQSNLSQLLAGWTLRTAVGPAQLSDLATNSWFAVRCISGPGATGSGEPPASSIMAKIRQGQRPAAEAQEYWLKLEADLPRWAEWFSHPDNDLPRLDLTVTGRKDYLRSQARLIFRDPIVPRAEKWDVPLPILRDPLISFTAVQGLAPRLKNKPLVQELGLDKEPNQLFLWALSQTAFQLQAAVPVSNPTNAFQRIAGAWVPRFNRVLDPYAVGEVRSLTNRAELMWRGLPLLVPYLQPVQESNKGFLHAGIFPVAPPTNPPPHQLMEQLSHQTNVLYYHWEITQARLDQLRPLLQLVSVFLTLSPMSTNSSPSKWLDAIQPRLGNTVTEVSVASPRELRVVRTSHLGLNGLEILSLADWLEGTNFPHLNLNIRFRPVIRSRGQKHAR